MRTLRLALAGVLVLAILLGMLGVATGSSPRRERAPEGAALAAARSRVDQGGTLVRKGREEFSEEGCDRCHAMAVTGADGRIGPRLDTLADDDRDAIIDSIVNPRSEIEPGYPRDLMPTDYGDLPFSEVKALAAFIKAASGGKDG